MAQNKKPRKSSNNRSSSRSGRSNSKGKGHKRDSRRDIHDNMVPNTNDFSWYNKYPQLTEAVGRIPFAKRPGMGYGLSSYYTVQKEDEGYTSTSFTNNMNETIPAVMAIHWTPTIGNSTDNMSPASVAAREMYAAVRRAYSGSLAVDGPDLIMYVLALDSVFSMLSWMKRIYRTLNSFSPTNKAIPYGLLACEGFTSTQVENLLENKTAIYGKINSLIYNASKFTCPDIMEIFKRHYWMSSNVYLDAPSKMGQIYMFIPDGFYKYNDQGENGTQLDYVPNSFSGNNPFDSIYDKCYALIAALSGSDDAYTINGYLARAFENKPQYTVALLQEHEVLDFVYDEVVLSQINNIHTPYNAASSDVTSITQDPLTNAVMQKIELPFSSLYYFPGKLLLNIRSDAPSVEDVVEATRLMSTILPSGEVECGTEFVTYISRHSNSTVNPSYWTKDVIKTYVTEDLNAEELAFLSAFDWRPPIYNFDTEYDRMTPIAQIYNATPIDIDQLADIHEICIYSEFNSFSIRD